jgi:hypothetical protein
MSAPTVNFGFLSHDVKRQRELAQQALDEAKRLDKLLTDEPDHPRKPQLEDAKKKWLEMARDLAENANTTSISGSSVIQTIVSTTSR